jgi:tetratricopeptide (TPR) repeat protein
MADPTRTRPAADPDATASADGGSTVDRSAAARIAALADTGSDPGLDNPAPPADPPGFELGELIGRGGMGVVYRARDMELNREVAVKLLQAKFAPGSAAARRFVEEAHVTARLQHPGVPPVYRVGELPDGRPFLAMKLIRGQTLAELLAARGPGSTHWLGVFEGICQAVGYAHAHGVIHRDLKPANVMVGAFGEVQVMDWGLAKVLGERRDVGPPVAHDPTPDDPDQTAARPALDADRTRAGSVMGTPAFMAPEQATGDLDRIDRRADVFGLGAVLCSLLTGKPPYVGDTAVSTAQLAARGDLRECFARLDASGADPDLHALAKRCLSVEPDDRPADASELARTVAALRAAADERARTAEVERGKAEVAGREQRKRRRVVQWAGGVTAAVLLAGVAGTTAGMIQAEGRRAEAEKAYAKTAGVLDVMVSEITGDSLLTQRAISPEQRKFLSEVLTYYQEFAGTAGGDERVRARVANAAKRVGLIEVQLGRPETAAAAFRQAVDRYTALCADFPQNPGYRADLAACTINLGNQVDDAGDQHQAAGLLRKGLEQFETLLAAHPSNRQYLAGAAAGYVNLAVCLSRTDDWSEVEGCHRRGVELFTRLTQGDESTDRDYAGLAMSKYLLANHLNQSGNPANAEPEFREAIGIQQQLTKDFPTNAQYRSDLARSYTILGGLFDGLDRPDEAEPHFRKGMSLYEELAASHPAVTEYRSQLGGIYCDLGHQQRVAGRSEDSLTLYARAIVLLEEVVRQTPDHGKGRLFLRNSYWGRARALDLLNRHAEASADWDAAAKHSTPIEATWHVLHSAKSRARAGQIEAAVERVTPLLTLHGWEGDQLYDMAVIFAVAAKRNSSDPSRYADTAVKMMQQAVKAGYKDAAHLKADADLAPLRDRDDFRTLVADLEAKFPPKKPETLPAPQADK